MVKTVNDELSTAKKELWNMKVELKRLKDIAFLVKDQINRLQVCYLYQSCIQTTF